MAVATVNVAAGFHSDVTKLLKRFSEAEKIQMEEFTRIWQEMKFMKIFLYREEVEIVLFTEECFTILLRLMLGQHPLPFRVGSVFCLYSMYFIQPSEPKIMIRLVPETWKGFLALIDECQLEPWETEVKFAFWTLAYRNAFLFVARPHSIGLVATSVEDESVSNATFPNLMEDYMSSDHQYLQELHNRYMGIKDSLSPCSAKTVQMVDRDLFATVENNLESLQAKHNSGKDAKQSKVYLSQSDDDDNYASEENRSDNEDEDDTLERRRKVRKKHQALEAVQSKSRRHRVSNKNVTQTETKRGRGRPRGQTSTDTVAEFFDYGDRPFQHLETATEEETILS